jgi:hypothetical protein
MSKLVVKLIVAAASSVLVFSAVAPASAATWLVTNVLTVGNDGGFGASSFHDARGNEMSGLNIATINGNVFGAPPNASGSYNDVTGVLDFTAMATQGANIFTVHAVSVTGSAFNGAGYLAAHDTLDVTMTGDLNMPAAVPTILANTLTEIGFMLGDVCCSGTDNPNSFTQPGANADERWITLWGANNFNATNGTYDEVSETTLGMDVRLRLERSTTTSEVPAPAVTVIFGFGLIGLA